MEKNNELCFAPYRELWVLIVLCWVLLAASIALVVLMPQTAWRIAMALTAVLLAYCSADLYLLTRKRVYLSSEGVTCFAGKKKKSDPLPWTQIRCVYELCDRKDHHYLLLSSDMQEEEAEQKWMRIMGSGSFAEGGEACFPVTGRQKEAFVAFLYALPLEERPLICPFPVRIR